VSSPSIVIIVRGGCVQNVIANEPVQVALLDYDVHLATHIIDIDGFEDMVYAEIFDVEEDDTTVSKIFRAIEEKPITKEML